MEEDWEGEVNMRGDAVELYRPMEPHNLFPYDSAIFGILEGRHLCIMGREGRTFRGGTSLPHYPIHLFYTILSFSFCA